METESALAAIRSLRLRKDEDGSILAIPLRKRLKGSFLFWYSKCVLGIYYAAPTRHSTTTLRQWWEKQIHTTIVDRFPADYDGQILFKATRLEDIPTPFFRKGATPCLEPASPYLSLDDL